MANMVFLASLRSFRLRFNKEPCCSDNITRILLALTDAIISCMLGTIWSEVCSRRWHQRPKGRTDCADSALRVQHGQMS
ncbi:hypothetical protein SprV_0401423700 [Sparganum proliferum]